jgi:hypothetical protein
MAEQLTTSAEALRLFFTDDIYLVRSEDVAAASALPAFEPASLSFPSAPPVSAALVVKEAQSMSAGLITPASEVAVPVVVPLMADRTLSNGSVSAEAIATEVSPIPSGSPSAPISAAMSSAAPAVTAPAAVPSVSSGAPVSAASLSAAPAASEMVFRYLGKNQKKVLILVNDGENEVSTDAGRELLRNLVKAMQLTANDFALLNYFNYNQIKFEELSKFFGSVLILGFGVSPAQLGLDDQSLHSVGTHGGVKLVFTGRLDLLAGDQDGKKKLWSSLKQFTF